MTTTPVGTRTRTHWDLDPTHSSIRFSVKHLNISTVHGRFNRWTGDVLFDEADLPRSQVNVRIEAASIDTHEPKRDAHLCSADFFDTAKHPEITFRSTRIEATTKDAFRLNGDLAISGVTRTVALDAELLGKTTDPQGSERAAFEATTTIDRRDFGLVWGPVLEAGGLLVGEKVKIEISIEAVRRPDAMPGPRTA